MTQSSAMNMYRTTPIGSLLHKERSVEEAYLSALPGLPGSVFKLVTSSKTSSFIRGLAKNYDFPNSVSHSIAFMVLKLSFGDANLAQLPAMLSTELKIANDKAQKIATEIEKELFAPIALDLNQYLAKKKGQSIVSKFQSSNKENPAQTSNMPSNLLDLKKQPRPPAPPLIPPKR